MIYDDYKLYKMDINFGRMGDMVGLFVEKPENLMKLVGKTIYLGKHSEIELRFETEEDVRNALKEQPISTHTVRELVRVSGNLTIVGINPMEYIYDEE